jgi:hypothetical protein
MKRQSPSLATGARSRNETTIHPTGDQLRSQSTANDNARPSTHNPALPGRWSS